MLTAEQYNILWNRMSDILYNGWPDMDAKERERIMVCKTFCYFRWMDALTAEAKSVTNKQHR